VVAEVDRKLRHYEMTDVFDVHISDERNQDGCLQPIRVALKLRMQQWNHRRSNDGFNVVVSHPKLPQSAIELYRLYTSKDKVEKDFETIKGLVKLRPVRHRQDGKVRAHVTLCMLALLLERTLDNKLRNKCSAKRASETLST